MIQFVWFRRASCSINHIKCKRSRQVREARANFAPAYGVRTACLRFLTAERVNCSLLTESSQNHCG